MRHPKKYEDIQHVVEETIHKRSPSDIISVLSFECEIGPIIPWEHCEKLQIHEALLQVKENNDEEVLREVHSIFKEYFDKIIDYFMSFPMGLDGSVFDDDYLLIEKGYYLMFGLWSPRILLLSVDENLEGKKILYHEFELQKYTFCPMKSDEIRMKECSKCPLFLIKQKKSENSTNISKEVKTYFCKYMEMIGEKFDEEF